MVLTHPGEDVGIFPVSMSTLIQVHEVHVHGVPRNLLVVLGMEVQKRLAESLEAPDPHLGRRESVHPGDDSDALGIGFGPAHHVQDLGRGVGRAFIDNFHGKETGGVHARHHLA